MALTSARRRLWFGAWSTLLVNILITSCHGNSHGPVTLDYLRTGLVPLSEQAAFDSMSDTFFKQTGRKLRILGGVQEDTRDQLDLTRTLFHQRGSGPDVLQIDVTWLGVLHDDLLDLKPYFGSVNGHFTGPASPYAVGDKILALPEYVNGGMLAYRSDLLRKYGYSSPPRTWDELESMAKRIQNGERRGGNPSFWGYVWPGAAVESLTCNALEWQMSDGGGSIIERDSIISVNNPFASHAWERAKHWIGRISPPSTTAYKEDDVQQAFGAGRAAFARVWGGELEPAPQGRNTVILHYAGNHFPNAAQVSFTTLPAGNCASVSVLGGSGLAVSRYSSHPSEGAELIRFLEHAEPLMYQDGISPDPATDAVAYALEAPPTNCMGTKNVDNHWMISRPSTIAGRSYDQVSGAYFEAVHSVLTGEVTAPSAAAKLEAALVKITGFHARPVQH